MKTVGGVGRLRGVLAAFSAVSETMTIASANSFLCVAEFPGRSMREYAEILSISQSTMSRHLLDLGELNRKREPGFRLIEQQTDISDRRKNVYQLTPRGRALVAAITKALGG